MDREVVRQQAQRENDHDMELAQTQAWQTKVREAGEAERTSFPRAREVRREKLQRLLDDSLRYWLRQQQEMKLAAALRYWLSLQEETKMVTPVGSCKTGTEQEI
jgi:hypothetical protein